MVLSVAHRTPANAAAVEVVARAGANVFEVDVRLLRGQLVVTHFLPLVPGLPIRRDRWQLRWGDPTEPVLREVIELVPDGCEVMVDLKDDHGGPALALAEALAQTGQPLDRLYASSKHWPSLEVLARAGWRTWRTAGNPASLRRLERDGLGSAWAGTVRATLMRRDGAAERVVEKCGRVLAWTVNDPQVATSLVERGLLGITTDSPDVHAALRLRH